LRNSIITIIGTPKSGISILDQCLRMLGLDSIDDHAQTDIPAIHALLFQALDHSPTMAGPLPRGWMQNPGAEQARQRIHSLVASSRNETNLLFLADPFLCRFMSLWAKAFQEAGLAPRFVFMVRHPWEAAPSLAMAENLDLANAHLLWLAHVRETLRACQDQGSVLVTFDQLLANPVSILMRMGTELGLTWPKDPWQASSSLHGFIQPRLKQHHISNFPDKDKQAFQAYERLYQEIRRGQWPGMAEGSAVNPHLLSELDATFTTAKGVIPVQLPTTSEPDFVGSLLEVIGHYEKQATSRQAGQKRTATNPGPPLFAQLVFSSTRESGKVVETIPLVADKWQHIVLPVTEPTLLRGKPMFLKPMNTNGTVMISAISLVNQATGECVWSAKNIKDFDQIIVNGSVIRLPDRDRLILLITGNDPRINLSCGQITADSPMQYELWVKATKNQELVHSNVFLSLIANKQDGIDQINSESLNIPDGLQISRDEDALVNYLLENESDFSTQEKFDIFCEIGKHHIKEKNTPRAMHFFERARKIVDDIPHYLLRLASHYSNMNREDIALELYVISLLKKAFIDEEYSNKLVQKFKQLNDRLKKPQEHGHQMLMDYIKNDIEYLRSHAKRKLTLIEIGSTREDIPGQGSTIKLAKFCKMHGLHFITVDMDPQNTSLAKHDLLQINSTFQAFNQKGEDFLRDYNGPMDFVFLDAYDFDHANHSEERQIRYAKYLGERISNEACHKMHLECAKQVRKRLSYFGAVCIDDTWFKNGSWRAKGKLAVPYLLEKNFWVLLSSNNSVLLSSAKNKIKIINTLKIHLEYDKTEIVNSMIATINAGITGRVCATSYLHGLYLIKKYMGKSCETYVETGTLFGGSLILLMQDATPCRFVGIDTFNGYYNEPFDPMSHRPVNLETTTNNIEKFNVHKHPYDLIQGSSYHTNTIVEFEKLSVGIDLLFIDGDHSYQGVTRDYHTYKKYVNCGGFIVFDNYGQTDTWVEVADAVRNIVFDQDGYEKIGQYGYSYIIKKIRVDD